MRRLVFVAFVCCTMMVSACGPNRAAKDARLQEACLTAIRSLYDQNDVIELQETSFSSATSPENTKLRVVSFRAHYVHNHGIIQQKNYSCSFEEPLFAIFSDARFYNVDRAGLKIGNFDGNVEGSFEDIATLNKITDDVLSGP